MDRKAAALQSALQEVLGPDIVGLEVSSVGEVLLRLAPEHLLDACRRLKESPQLDFAQLVDLIGVDYLEYLGERKPSERFAVVYHLLSFSHNWRLRVQVLVHEEPPLLDSVTGIWASADWYEREAFDLFGIVFDGHDDLRRILTDYGFIGHPFRKDFPLSGNVEMRYDPELGRVVYEPVSIVPRVTVPRVVRHDHRYEHPAED